MGDAAGVVGRALAAAKAGDHSELLQDEDHPPEYRLPSLTDEAHDTDDTEASKFSRPRSLVPKKRYQALVV